MRVIILIEFFPESKLKWFHSLTRSIASFQLLAVRCSNFMETSDIIEYSQIIQNITSFMNWLWGYKIYMTTRVSRTTYTIHFCTIGIERWYAKRVEILFWYHIGILDLITVVALLHDHYNFKVSEETPYCEKWFSCFWIKAPIISDGSNL